MAEFARAVEVVLSHEGAYSEDHAGATRWGVILAVLREEDPAWADRDGDGDVDADDVRALTREEAAGVFRRQWWDRYGYGSIASQAVATKLFDLAVNLGPAQAHRVAQRAVRAAKRADGASTADRGGVLADDGVLGPRTRAALADAPEAPLLAAMRAEAAGVYRLILARHPEWEAYRAGWLTRAYD